MTRQLAQRTRSHGHCNSAERQVDPKNERPMQLIGKNAAENRADNACDHKHDRGVALRHRPFARRKKIGNDRLRQRYEAAAAETLQAASDNEQPNVRRHRACERPDNKYSDRYKNDGAAPVNVGKFAEQRRGRGRGQ